MRRPALLVFTLIALVGCSSPVRSPEPDGGVVESGYDLHRTVMSWNLGNFVGDGGEPGRVAAIVRDAGPDLLAVEEVADDAALSALMTELPGYSGVLAPASAASSTQHVALLWKDTVHVASTSPLFDGDPAFPRAVLKADVDLELGATGDQQLKLYVVHFKAGVTASSEDLRVQEATALNNIVRSDLSTNAVVIGDFNEAIGDSRSAEVFGAFGADAFSVPSLALADAGTVSFLPAGIMLDHCVISHGLDGALDAGALSVPRLDQSVPNYGTDVSDHLPLILDLHFIQ